MFTFIKALSGLPGLPYGYFSWRHLAGRPVSHGFIHAAHSPIELAKAMLAILGTVLVIYLIYLFTIYPFFASLRPSIAKDSFGIDWQLDVDVEEMINAIVEESATTPLLLLNMALADLLTETPVGEWNDFLKNIWLNYVPVVTNSRARGAAYFRTEQPAASEEELNRIMRWAGEALKVTTNRDDPERKFNCAAFPLVLNGQAIMVLAAYWPKRHPFKNIFNLVAQQFGIIRSQYILASEVSSVQLEKYDNPWETKEVAE